MLNILFGVHTETAAIQRTRRTTASTIEAAFATQALVVAGATVCNIAFCIHATSNTRCRSLLGATLHTLTCGTKLTRGTGLVTNTTVEWIVLGFHTHPITQLSASGAFTFAFDTKLSCSALVATTSTVICIFLGINAPTKTIGFCRIGTVDNTLSVGTDLTLRTIVVAGTTVESRDFGVDACSYTISK